MVLCKFKLVGAWREVVVRGRMIRSEKLRKNQYREEYTRSFEGKRVEGGGDNNVEHMREQVKWAMVDSPREVCGSVKKGGKVCDGTMR